MQSNHSNSSSSESTLRAKRAAVLEEKKRRLQQLQARRSNRTTLSASSNHSLSELSLDSLSTTGGGVVVAAVGGHLEDYIDGLLNTLPPLPPKTPPSISTPRNVHFASSVSSPNGSNNTIWTEKTVALDRVPPPNMNQSLSSPPPMVSPRNTSSHFKHKNDKSIPDDMEGMHKSNNFISALQTREVFTVGTQTEDEDAVITHSTTTTTTTAAGTTTTTADEDTDPPRSHAHRVVPVQRIPPNHEESSWVNPPPLDWKQTRDKTLSTLEFSAFLNSASKKVERLLGAPTILSTLFLEDTTRYLDTTTHYPTSLQDPKVHSSQQPSPTMTRPSSSSLHPLMTGQVSFTFPTWTWKRDITWMDWSCHSKTYEWILTSYSSPHTSTTTDSSTTTLASSSASSTPLTALSLPSNHPSSTSSSSLLLPRSETERLVTQGLVLIWNITLSSRPEYVLTCTSSITICKFHPMDVNFIVGCTESGQVVLWDLRNGSRFPVQKSRLSYETVSGQGGGGGGHSIVGMEFILQESMMVTASSDGYIQYWSMANLMEPVDIYHIPGAHFSSMALVPESHALLLGDENGTLYQFSSSSNSVALNDASTTKFTCVTISQHSSHASLRRNVRILHPRATDEVDDNHNNSNSQGHYGMITGISTKTLPTTQTGSLVFSKDIPRGVHGLVLTCGVDWTSKLWAPAFTDQPLMTWMSHSYDYMSNIRWNPVHPSVFASSGCDGAMHVWNLSTSMDQPLTGFDGIQIESTNEARASSSSTSTNISSTAVLSRGLNHIQWSLDGRRIAVACADTLYVLGFSEDVWKPRVDEGKRFMNLLVSRGFLEQDG